MKGRRRRPRDLPPWLVRASLFAAAWPRSEYYEYKFRLLRRYLKDARAHGPAKAKKQCARDARHWLLAAAWRVISKAYLVWKLVQ